METNTATRSNTYGVLDSQDILGRIFEHLNVNSYSADGRLITSKQVLLWTALTCKAFLNPALDVLWYSMNSLLPLLRLLKPFYLNNDTYVLRGTIQDADWELYYRYAGRVREFIYNGDNSEDRKIAFHTRVRIAQLWTRPLFPSLNRLICPEVQAPGLFIHFLFLSPTIEHVELKLISEVEDEAIGTLLHTISESVPSLKRLVMSGWLTEQSLSYIPQLKRLQSLEITNMGLSITSELLQQLGALEYLSNLSIDLSGSPLSSFKLAGLFNPLLHFRIKAQFSIIKDILADIWAPQLESIHVIAPAGPFPQGWVDYCKGLFELISLRWSSLQSITLDHDGDWDHEVLPTHVLLPLLQIHTIMDFEVKGYFISTTDEDIKRYASAWPSLRSLYLPFDLVGNPVYPSLATLLALATSCPNLQHLQIPLNIGHIPPLSLPDTSSHRLQTLSIGSYNVPVEFSQSFDIARHIDRLFPFLKVVKHGAGNDPYVWEKIFVIIQTFQSIRLDGLSLRP